MGGTDTTADQEPMERVEASRVTERLDAIYEEEIPTGLDQVLGVLQSLSLPEERW